MSLMTAAGVLAIRVDTSIQAPRGHAWRWRANPDVGSKSTNARVVFSGRKTSSRDVAQSRSSQRLLAPKLSSFDRPLPEEVAQETQRYSLQKRHCNHPDIFSDPPLVYHRQLKADDLSIQ